MHCPSCGAEGRIPGDKVNTRLLCKRCLKSFHLTPSGQIVAGSPAEAHPAHYQAASHDLDHAEEEVQHWIQKFKSAIPKVVAAAVLVALGLGFVAYRRATRPLGLDEQATRVAQALAGNDLAALRKLSTTSTDTQATELAEAIKPEFVQRQEAASHAAPSVQLSRKPEAPGPGLSELVASIDTNRRVGRMGVALPDESPNTGTGGPVEIALIFAGDDRSGWRLDAGKTLEAFRRSRTPDVAKVGRLGPPPR